MKGLSVLFAVALVMGCKDHKGGTTTTPGGETGEDTAPEVVTPPDPGPDFDRYCGGSDWTASAVDAIEGEVGGNRRGSYEFGLGTKETMKVVPTHPFYVETLYVCLAGESGAIDFRIVESLGRTYPILDDEAADLIEPIEANVELDDNGRGCFEFDVSDQGAFLQPTQHYILVAIEYNEGPAVQIQSLPDGEYSRALLFQRGDENAYGIDGNYYMELWGQHFCAWEDEDRWFGKDVAQPWDELVSGRIGALDLNGDGHDDVVGLGGGARVWWGDGTGAFSDPEIEPFPDSENISMLLLGDVDNDGDVDAFAAPYVGADDDGDGVAKDEGDCDDGDAAINPDATEVADNGRDDDCDGVADEGTDTTDADGDGVGIADGDCNDTDADVHPGAAESKNNLDDDCDLAVDEDFTNQILINDGEGLFVALPDSGVERVDPSTAAAFGDGDGDGILDIYWGNWLRHYPDDPAVPDAYFSGQGDGGFVDTMSEAGLVMEEPLSCYGVVWTDYNNDSWPDIYVSNYHLYANQLWQNQGDGTFVDVAEELGAAYDDVDSGFDMWPGGHSYGTDWGDIDNDGDMDAYVTNLAHPRNYPWSDPSMLLINTGEPDYAFLNMREEYGLEYDEGDINAVFADFDNDMDIDLAIASLYPNHYSRLYRNDGPDGFTDVTYETGTAIHNASGVAWSDVDEDGDLDLFITDGADAPYMQLFINRIGQDKHWVELDLVGTTANADAVGARVTLEAGGVSQMRDVQRGDGHSLNQSTHVVHFGLGDNTSIDAVRVQWPWGEEESFSGVGADGRWVLTQGTGEAQAR